MERNMDTIYQSDVTLYYNVFYATDNIIIISIGNSLHLVLVLCLGSSICVAYLHQL